VYRERERSALRANDGNEDADAHSLNIAGRTWEAQDVDHPQTQRQVNVIRVVGIPASDRSPFVHECSMMQGMPTTTDTGKAFAKSQIVTAIERFTSLTREELAMFRE